MKEEYKDYYLYLEKLRESGITNMYGAAPYLADAFDLDIATARTVLTDWMKNYKEISEKYYSETK